MNGVDLKIPVSDYRLLNKIRTFNLIVPAQGELGEKVRLDYIIRLMALEDEFFFSLLADPEMAEEINVEENVLTSKCMSIQYLRECSLRNVSKREWENNYGPKDKYHFVLAHKFTSQEQPVKVICLADKVYSLALFNKTYGKRLRQR